jgi:hypothetical protein
MFIHHNLRANAEYRMRWADRIQQHCFGDGVLTANSLHQRISARAAIIDRVIVAESARWGDAQTGEPLTRREWRGARDQLLNEYLPNRGEIVIRQLREDGLYPTISAPVSEPAGGAISFGSPVRVSTSKGVVSRARLQRQIFSTSKALGASYRSRRTSVRTGPRSTSMTPHGARATVKWVSETVTKPPLCQRFPTQLQSFPET